MPEPVTLALAKDHCRVIGSDEDDLIERLIGAARAHIERATGLTLVERPVVQVFDDFSMPLRLSAWPIAATPALSVEYRDSVTGSWTAVTPSPVALDGRYPALAVPAFGTTSWPAPFAAPRNVRVTVTAGYPPDAVPEPLVQAMLLLIGHWYGNREAGVVGSISTEIDFGVGLLTEDFRRFQ